MWAESYIDRRELAAPKGGVGGLESRREYYRAHPENTTAYMGNTTAHAQGLRPPAQGILPREIQLMLSLP
jgi:hypothetical protein